MFMYTSGQVVIEVKRVLHNNRVVWPVLFGTFIDSNLNVIGSGIELAVVRVETHKTNEKFAQRRFVFRPSRFLDSNKLVSLFYSAG